MKAVTQGLVEQDGGRTAIRQVWNRSLVMDVNCIKLARRSGTWSVTLWPP